MHHIVQMRIPFQYPRMEMTDDGHGRSNSILGGRRYNSGLCALLCYVDGQLTYEHHWPKKTEHDDDDDGNGFSWSNNSVRCVCDLIPQKIRQVKRELKICTTHTSMALARVQTRFLQNM